MQSQAFSTHLQLNTIFQRTESSNGELLSLQQQTRPIWLFLHHGVLFHEILYKSKYKAIDALGIELPFLALAVETTKPL